MQTMKTQEQQQADDRARRMDRLIEPVAHGILVGLATSHGVRFDAKAVAAKVREVAEALVAEFPRDES